MGRREEALGVALAGQLWAPALILAFGHGAFTSLPCAGELPFALVQHSSPMLCACY